MLRLLQNVLFVFGATSTAVVVAAGLAFLASLTVFPSGRDAGGAVVGFVLLAIGGGVIGATAGLLLSIRWIARQSAALWTTGTWIGVLVGVIAALAVRFSTVLDGIVLGYLVEWLPGTIIFLAAMAFLGGVIGRITMARAKRIATERP